MLQYHINLWTIIKLFFGVIGEEDQHQKSLIIVLGILDILDVEEISDCYYFFDKKPIWDFVWKLV